MKSVRAWVRLSLLGLLGFGACSTLQVDSARTGSIRRVAVVGFSVQQELPPTVEWKIGGSGREHSHGPNLTSSLGQESEYATQMYAALQKSLKAEFHWTLVDRVAISQNAEYRKLYDQKMKGWQNRPPGAANTESLSASGIMDSWPIEMLETADRQALTTQLGVDAVAVATVRIKLENGGGLKRLVGAGDYKPRATVSIALYDLKSPDPAWKDVNAIGAPAEGVGHVLGITSKSALDVKAVEAAENSYRKLLARYRETQTAAN